MNAIPVGRDRKDLLSAEMARLGVREDDIVEKFVLGSGPGGQKVNKTSSCVYLRHQPTGIELKCRASRSRDLNRFLARRELCERIRRRREGEISERRAEIEKIRRRKRRRSRRQKERMLEAKRRGSEKKHRRRPVGPDE
jgi:protein subunit release factor B